MKTIFPFYKKWRIFARRFDQETKKLFSMRLKKELTVIERSFKNFVCDKLCGRIDEENGET